MSEATAAAAAAPAPAETGIPDVSLESAPAQAESTAADAAAAAAPAPAADDDEADQLAAVRQLEFYFADANLPYDKFMWTLHSAAAEHWVPLATVASFKRMRPHTARGLEWVAGALRARSTVLEVDGTGAKVRRTAEVQEPKGAFERSVYAKGFGDEQPGLQQKLEAFFDKYGRTNAVRMRRKEDKLFKGSVFAEFADASSVDAFLNADPKPEWDGQPLVIMSKDAYCEMKIKEKGLTGKAAVHRRDLIAGPGTGAGKKGFNAFREMERAKSGSGGKEKGKEEKPEVWLDFMGTKLRVQEDEGGRGSVNAEDVVFVSGATLRFAGCGGDAPFDDIKKPLKERFTRAPYVKYEKGADAGLVGFDKALSEEEIQFVRDTIKTINGKDVTWAVASEDEAKAFQIERAGFAAQRVLGHAEGSGSGGRGGRGRGRGRGRGSSRGRAARGVRGGRGGARGDKGAADKGAADKGAADKAGGETGADGERGEKRKRAVEPDGGHDVGVRGAEVPEIQAAKKAKVDA